MLIVFALFLFQAPQASLEGRVVELGTDSPVARARLVLTKIQGQLADIRTPITDENGKFSIPNLAPGQYRLFAEREGYLRTEHGQRGASRTGMVITVAGTQNIKDIVVSMTPTGVIEGRIRNADGRAVRNVVVRALKPVYREGQRSLNSVPVGSDGTFTVSSMSLGDYRLRIAALPQTWYIKSAVLGTTDVLNTGLHIEVEPRISFNILVSANGGILDALVLDTERRPAQGVTVALVPDPSRRNRYDLYKTAATDASGRVRLQGIAPGEYKAFAWAQIDADSWQDPGIIRVFENRGEPVRFDEGARQSITLAVIGRSQ